MRYTPVKKNLLITCIGLLQIYFMDTGEQYEVMVPIPLSPTEEAG
jgi:hypothetical protein